MTVSEDIKNYLETSGESMRSLSLRAGLGEKAVADIVRNQHCRPRLSTLVALADVTSLSLANSYSQSTQTYSDLIRAAKSAGDAGLATRLNWICKRANWVPQTKMICKQDVIDFFAKNSAGAFDLTSGTYSTYKTTILKGISCHKISAKQRSIADIGGIHREIYDCVCESDISYSLRLKSGPFFVYLNDEAIFSDQISADTLAAYYNYRVQVSAKGEDTCEKHVREIATLVAKLAHHPDFQKYGFKSVSHPFFDGRNKFGVSELDIAEVLAEFDECVGPWATGLASRDGQSKKDFLKYLDNQDVSMSDIKALLFKRKMERKALPGQDGKAAREQKDEVLRKNGFLTSKERWSSKTLKRRRGYVVSIAKALMASMDIALLSIEQLTDPDFLESAAEALQDANTGEYESGYIGSILKCMRKLAVGYVARSVGDIQEIDRLITHFDRKHEGIAPRNRAKLKLFTKARIQETIDLGALALVEINKKVDLRRKAKRAKIGILPPNVDVFDAELVCDVMAVIAHEILLARAPRSSNVIEARLDWIVDHGDRMQLVIPAAQVKARSAQDAALVVPLSAATSKLLRSYIGSLREKALTAGDERNPYLFPSQKRANFKPDQFYTSLLQRVTKLLEKHAHVSIHPHLYRHLIGWIWLKESTANLPKVQILLGHKNLQTTLNYYAELDQEVVLNDWQKFINDEKAA